MQGARWTCRREFGAVPDKAVTLNLNGCESLPCPGQRAAARRVRQPGEQRDQAHRETRRTSLSTWTSWRIMAAGIAGSGRGRRAGHPRRFQGQDIQPDAEGHRQGKGHGPRVVPGQIARGKLRRPRMGRGPGSGRPHEGRQVRGHAARVEK